MSVQPENVRERTLRTRSFACLAINHFLYCKSLHYYNFGARIVESWDTDNMGKTKDIGDMLETYLLASPAASCRLAISFEFFSFLSLRVGRTAVDYVGIKRLNHTESHTRGSQK